MSSAQSNFVQSSFLGGEWSPYAQGRTDVPAYKTGMNVCRNGFPIEEGAWLRRSGSKFIAPTRGGAAGRIMKFAFTQSSPYYIEFTDLHQRMYASAVSNQGLFNGRPKELRVVTTNDNQQIGASGVSTASPAVVETAGAHGWATNDQIVFLFDNTTVANQTPLLCNRQFIITVIDATHFSLADALTNAAIDGSTLGWSTAVATFGTVVVARILQFVYPYTNGDWAALRTVQAEAALIMLHNTYQPQSLAAITFPTVSAFATFTGGAITFTDGPYLDPPTDASTITPSATAGSITVTASSQNSINKGQGFLATDVGRLIRILSEPPAWNVATAYVAGNSVKFNNVYFTCIQNNTGQTPDIAIAYWAINTAAATWSWLQIAARTNTLVVTATVMGATLLYTGAASIWRMGVYSNTTGWPTCGVYYEGRLFLAGAVDNRFDASVSNGITPATPLHNLSVDFTPTAPDGTVSDASAISYVLNADDVNPILWMKGADSGILCGTLVREWLIRASALSDPITPTSIQAHPVSTYGCANMEPAHTELSVCFVHRYGRKILEAFPDAFSGRYSAPNLTKFAKHLTTSGISEIKYQQELLPSLWARMGDGSIAGCTYKRNTQISSQPPEFFGWHRHDFGSLRTVESIEVGPSVDGTIDTLAMVTYDSTTNLRYFEVMQDLFDIDDDIEDGWFLDTAIVPSGGVIAAGPSGNSLTLYGLWHLNGKSVTVSVGGCDAGDATVSNGAVSVPIDVSVGADFTQTYLASISSATAYGAKGVTITAGAASYTVPAVVGFTFTSQGQVLRPDAPDSIAAPNTAGFAKSGRVNQFGVFMENTQGISFGTDFTTSINAAQLISPGGTVRLTNLQLFSGIYWNTIADDFDFDSMICWQITRPYPAAITELAGFMKTVNR